MHQHSSPVLAALLLSPVVLVLILVAVSVRRRLRRLRARRERPGRVAKR